MTFFLSRGFKSREVPTYSEPIKEVISWVLVLHEELQVFEHLERRKGWSWSETEHTAPRHLPHLHLPPHPDTLICIQSMHPTTAPTCSTSRTSTETSNTGATNCSPHPCYPWHSTFPTNSINFISQAKREAVGTLSSFNSHSVT